jgi:uncharacterized DUF497 family protein
LRSLPDLRVVAIDWDDGNRAKCGKHGVTLAEIEQALRGELVVVDDPEHSAVEPRFRGVGRTRSGRHVFVAFTIRGDYAAPRVRPISARYMHRKEIERYERQAVPDDGKR